MVEALGESVSFYKIGMELAYGGGLPLAQELAESGKQVLLDLKQAGRHSDDGRARLLSLCSAWAPRHTSGARRRRVINVNEPNESLDVSKIAQKLLQS